MSTWNLRTVADYFVDRILPIFRPPYRNWITWAVVGAGITVAAGPIYEPYVRAALAQYLQLSLSAPPDSWVGVAIISIGLAYNLIAARIDYSWMAQRDKAPSALPDAGLEESRDHDAAIFLSFCDILNEEVFRSFTGRLWGDHRYYDEDFDVVWRAAQYLEQPSSRFLIEPLRKRAEDLIVAFRQLFEFIGTRFFVWPENQRRTNTSFCMQPEQNIDRGGSGDRDEMAFYDQMTNELNGNLKDVDAKFLAFIHEGHAQLRTKVIRVTRTVS